MSSSSQKFWEDIIANLIKKGVKDPVSFIKSYIPDSHISPIQEELNKTMVNWLKELKEEHQNILSKDLKKFTDQKCYKIVNKSIIWNNKYTYGSATSLNDFDDNNDKYHIAIKPEYGEVYTLKQGSLVKQKTNEKITDQMITDMKFEDLLEADNTIFIKGVFSSQIEANKNVIKVKNGLQASYYIFVADKNDTSEIIDELNEIITFIESVGWRL